MTDMSFGVPRALHLLPKNSTPLERALSASDARVLDAPTAMIRTVPDPDRCPLHLLPYLAAHWGVDEWDDAWPEEVKRAVIRNAPEIHRTRGTRAAVERALAPFNIKAQIREWFEMVPAGPPHTFSITAYVTERLLEGTALVTPKLLAQVRRAVLRAKRHSQWFSLAIGVATHRGVAVTSRARVLGAPQVAQVARPLTDMAQPVAMTTRVRLLGAAVAAAVTGPVKDLGRSVALVTRVRVLGVLSLNMEAITL